MLRLPHVSDVRYALAGIPDALIDEPAHMAGRVAGDGPEHVLNPVDALLGGSLVEVPSGALDVDDLFSDTPPSTFELPPELDDGRMREALAEMDRGTLGAAVKVQGIDALAWYMPFHQNLAQHGIYISSAGILQLVRSGLMSVKYSADLHEDLTRKINLSYYALLRHEAFHFAVECMAANWEISSGKACYLKAQRQAHDGGLNSSHGFVLEEEALANAYMLRGFRYPNRQHVGSKLSKPLIAFTAIQPPGYRDGPNFVATRRYLQGCHSLALAYHRVMNLGWSIPPFGFDASYLYPNPTSIDWRRCPVIFVDTQGLFHQLGIRPGFISRIIDIVETPTFQKQLKKLQENIQKRWAETRRKLSQSTMFDGLDFKPWKPKGKNWFSVRVDGGVRAHLRLEGAGQWLAEEIGDHQKMGHG